LYSNLKMMAGKYIVSLLCAVTLVTQGHAAIDEHRITSLPGWDGDLPEMYSGYIPVGNTSGVPGFIHYWFIVSQNAPETDPVGVCIFISICLSFIFKPFLIISCICHINLILSYHGQLKPTGPMADQGAAASTRVFSRRWASCI
jgi:hypothetical protein